MKFPWEMVQREFHFAIVGEVDNIFIDEARTPLIISGPAEDAAELYAAIDKMIPKLSSDDYEKDEKQRTVVLTETGTENVNRFSAKWTCLTARRCTTLLTYHWSITYSRLYAHIPCSSATRIIS